MYIQRDNEPYMHIFTHPSWFHSRPTRPICPVLPIRQITTDGDDSELLLTSSALLVSPLGLSRCKGPILNNNEGDETQK